MPLVVGIFPAHVKGNFPFHVKFPDWHNLGMTTAPQTILAQRVTALMTALGKKAAPLSKAVGQGSSFVRDIQRKGVMPGADALDRLAVELRTNVDYLLGKSDDPSPASIPWTPDVQELVAAYLKLEDEAKLVARRRVAALVLRESEGPPDDPREKDQ